ncbi:MAG TPA: Gfo/Idh/MocA family oxidoreductase [Thermoanaerobacterales bacterium]|nr:Gfo/Idh/MocA family oxidoreductase [Thermoanaerobacterales bacterium]
MVRFGVVGTSWITDAFIKAASLNKDFKLNAVYSRTKERAKSFSEKYGVTNIFTDLEKMARSPEIDAVYIASPNSLHSEQSILFLNNRKHVLCEKPLASNSREVINMIKAAKENKVVLMEAMKTTFLPNFIVIKHNLHKIGKIRRAVVSYCQYSSRYDSFKQGKLSNIFNPQFSAGSLMDIGVYCVYPVLYLFGEPKEIIASCLLLDSGVDGQGTVCLKYDDMEAVIIHSKITDSAMPSEFQGEQGSIVLNRIYIPKKAAIYYRNGTVEDISQYQRNEEMYYEVNEFINLIKNGKEQSDVNSHNLSLSVMKVLDEARRQMGVVFPADSV